MDRSNALTVWEEKESFWLKDKFIESERELYFEFVMKEYDKAQNYDPDKDR